MNIKQSYAVFGLGRYGKAVAKELVENGAEVLAVDIDQDIVNDASSEIPYCKCADITDPDVIKKLGIANIDVVIIAMATTILLMEKLMGIPVSTSQAVVGAVIGAGLVTGPKNVNFGVFKRIAIAWVSSPTVAGLLTYLVGLATKAYFA